MNYTIQNFDKWDEVVDYESDETNVVLLNAQGEAIAEFNYPRFTLEDFNNEKARFEKLNNGDDDF